MTEVSVKAQTGMQPHAGTMRRLSSLAGEEDEDEMEDVDEDAAEGQAMHAAARCHASFAQCPAQATSRRRKRNFLSPAHKARWAASLLFSVDTRCSKLFVISLTDISVSR